MIRFELYQKDCSYVRIDAESVVAVEESGKWLSGAFEPTASIHLSTGTVFTVHDRQYTGEKHKNGEPEHRRYVGEAIEFLKKSPEEPVA